MLFAIILEASKTTIKKKECLVKTIGKYKTTEVSYQNE